ncbi:MAG: hypothetical protein QW303_05145 [Nitrososphaerota archaeon]
MPKLLKGKFEKFLLNFIISTTMMLMVLWPLTGIAHELGHGVVCWATGGEIYWPWVFPNLRLLCEPFPEQVKEISWAMGGSFGVLASLAPIFIFRVLRKWNWILNAFLGCVFMQFGYAIFESTLNESYKNNDLTTGLPIALLSTFSIVFFTLYIDKIRKYCSRKKSI